MFASAFYKASILIVVAFNVERYLYVCRPLWVYRSGILEKRACCVVVMALVIGLLCSIQWPLAWRVVELECNEPCEKEEIENNCFNVNKTQVLKYSIVVVKESLILQRVLPVENKEENQQNNCSNSNANAMLFAVVLLLFVCIGPQAAARLLYEWHGIYHLNSVLYTCITQQMKSGQNDMAHTPGLA
uniref:G-protein coupled receptors family 1 profile domain-containing protein n=1 Tax=Meloidogyne javanica TaxID=6303 RepID=A0A915M6I7_MELJA